MIIVEEKEIFISLKHGSDPVVEIKKNAGQDNHLVQHKIFRQAKERITEFNENGNCYVSDDQEFEQKPSDCLVDCRDKYISPVWLNETEPNHLQDKINNENLMSLSRDVFEFIKNKINDYTESSKSKKRTFKDIDDQLIEKIIKVLMSSGSNGNDGNACKTAVWEKICAFQTEIFSKRQLTVTLQKKYTATQIDQALKLLCTEGLISEIKDIITKRENGKPGRSKSPKYRVNNFGNKVNLYSKRSVF